MCFLTDLMSAKRLLVYSQPSIAYIFTWNKEQDCSFMSLLYGYYFNCLGLLPSWLNHFSLKTRPNSITSGLEFKHEFGGAQHYINKIFIESIASLKPTLTNTTLKSI